MAKYFYKIGNKSGKVEKGSVEAKSRPDAVSQIKKRGWFVLELGRKEQGRLNLSLFKKKDSLSSSERINFTDHLASMIESGSPIGEALEVYAEDGKKGATLIDGINKDIQRGRKISEAMALYPETFSPLYLALIQAGELTGSLDETLSYLASDLRREHEFKEKIKSALLYPALVLTVSFVVILLLVLLVIPKISLITKSFGGDLPFITRVVSSGADFLTRYGPLMVGLFAFSVVAFFFLLKDKRIKEKVQPRLLKTPLVGDLMKKYILARFQRIVGSCIKYGISMTVTLDIAGGVVNNVVYKNSCRQINKKIIQGESLASALASEGVDVFPNIIVRTVRGAEKTGGVDKALLRLSNTYENEIDRDLKRVTELIEPALVIVLGLVVAVIAISVIAPIYSLTSRIK